MLRPFILFICSTISVTANSQSINEDSLHLSKHLEPFRKHLDSVTSGINAKHLLTLYETNFIKTSSILTEIEPMQAKINEDSIKKLLKQKRDWSSPYRYSYDQIIPNDTSSVLFIETEYDLKNRSELEKLKVKYIQSKTLKDQIYCCISYINELSRFYPSSDNWKFSKSQTLNRYIKFTSYLIERLPKDSTRSYILGDFGYTLQQIDRIELQSYILQLYLKALQLLTATYTKYLKDNNLSDDTGHLRKYLNQGSVGNALVNINYFISELLDPEESFDIKTELYPFLKKRLFYLERTLKLLELQKGKNNLPDNYTRAEEKYLKALTVFKVSEESKYYSNILYDRIILLKNYMAKLLYPRTDSLAKKREYNLYYSLGTIFLNQKEYQYALKAFYKAAEIRLHFTSLPMSIEDVPVFADIFETIINDVKDRSFKQKQAITDVVNLYQSILNRDSLYNKYDSLLFDVFKLFGHSALMIYEGEVDKAELLLVSKKKELFQDSIYNSSPTILSLLYRGLLNTNWNPNKYDKTFGNEKEADSGFYHYKINGSLDVETSYNGDEHLTEKFSSLESIENTSYWDAKILELNEQIDQKTLEISTLNETREMLNMTVSKLNAKIESVGLEIKSLNNELLHKKREINLLSNRFLEKNNLLSIISIKNSELERNIKTASIRLDNLNKYANTLQVQNNGLRSVRGDLLGVISLLLLCFIPIFIVMRRKVLRIKGLDKEIANKEKEAEEKDLGKKLAEQKLLNDTALGHDLIELVDYIPYSIKSLGNDLPSDIKNSDEFSKCQKFAEKVRDYFRENFDLKEEQVNTVRKDIDLAIQYCSLLQMMNSNDGTVNVDIKTIDPDLLAIEIPKHNMVNFISNSYRHGRVNEENVNIDIEGTKTPHGFTIKITDNGGGFETLNLEDKRNTRGIKLVLRQINNFNSLLKNKYRIAFGKDDIKNIFKNEIKLGTCVTYKIEKK